MIKASEKQGGGRGMWRDMWTNFIKQLLFSRSQLPIKTQQKQQKRKRLSCVLKWTPAKASFKVMELHSVWPKRIHFFRCISERDKIRILLPARCAHVWTLSSKSHPVGTITLLFHVATRHLRRSALLTSLVKVEHKTKDEYQYHEDISLMKNKRRI